MAETKQEGVSLKDLQPEVTTDDKTADLPLSTPAEMRQRAEDLPERDPVQKAYKQAMTADSHQKEARGFLKAAQESPNAMDTPSGYALQESVGESNDTKRGEKYARARAARRWGWVPVDES